MLSDMKLSMLSFAVLTTSAFLTGSAAAQISAGGGDVAIYADTQTFNDATGEEDLQGRVDIVQNDARLRADNVHALLEPKESGSGWGKMKRVEATGNVYYIAGDKTIKGDKAVYTADDQNLVVTGDVTVVQGKNVMNGSHLVYNTNTKNAVMTSSSDSPSKGRVRIVVTPNENK